MKIDLYIVTYQIPYGILRWISATHDDAIKSLAEAFSGYVDNAFNGIGENVRADIVKEHIKKGEYKEAVVMYFRQIETFCNNSEKYNITYCPTEVIGAYVTEQQNIKVVDLVTK